MNSSSPHNIRATTL